MTVATDSLVTKCCAWTLLCKCQCARATLLVFNAVSATHCNSDKVSGSVRRFFHPEDLAQSSCKHTGSSVPSNSDTPWDLLRSLNMLSGHVLLSDTISWCTTALLLCRKQNVNPMVVFVRIPGCATSHGSTTH